MNCWYCGTAVQFATSDGPINYRTMATKDHQVPNDPGAGRIVLACAPCNSRKGSRNVEEFRRYLFLKSPAGQTVDLLERAITFNELTSVELEHLSAMLARLRSQHPLPQFYGESVARSL
jgi:5-methylcytosine-specific restriction endonuclease McrA